MIHSKGRPSPLARPGTPPAQMSPAYPNSPYYPPISPHFSSPPHEPFLHSDVRAFLLRPEIENLMYLGMPENRVCEMLFENRELILRVAGVVYDGRIVEMLQAKELNFDGIVDVCRVVHTIQDAVPQILRQNHYFEKRMIRNAAVHPTRFIRIF